ncbi:hypothetical protein D3C80_1643970 [compost metagenome]
MGLLYLAHCTAFATASEGAFDMPEQLGLDQTRRDRGAIDRHEGPVGTATSLVQQAREHLFASACLAIDQNRNVAFKCFSRTLKGLLHHRVLQIRALRNIRLATLRTG